MDIKTTNSMEKSPRDTPTLFAVSLEDIKPLLDMDKIAPSARVFHRYAEQARQSSSLSDDSPPATLPLSDYFCILSELSVALQDETIHLSSRHLMPGSTHFIMSNIASCHNLQDAMKLIAKSYNILHGGPYNRVEVKDGSLHYIIDDSQFPYMSGNEDYIHFTMECVLIYLHGILSVITSQDLSPQLHKVYTKRERGPMGSRHMSFWTVPIRYQSGQYILSYDLSAAELPITIDQGILPSAGEIYDHVIAMIIQTATGEINAQDYSHRVRLSLEQGLTHQQGVAKHLGCSVATLRRRLTQDNTSFRQLSKDVLNEKSQQMIAQRFHIADIAEELGFSDFRSFIRAFKSWNGITPTAYSKELSQKIDQSDL